MSMREYRDFESTTSMPFKNSYVKFDKLQLCVIHVHIDREKRRRSRRL